MGCLGSKLEERAVDQGETINPTGTGAGDVRQQKPKSGQRTTVFAKPVWKTDEALTFEEMKVHCSPISMHQQFIIHAGSTFAMMLCTMKHVFLCIVYTIIGSFLVNPHTQAKREVFWDTSPHYGGSRGEHRRY